MNLVKYYLKIGFAVCIVVIIAYLIVNNPEKKLKALEKAGQEYLMNKDGVQYVKVNDTWVKAEDIKILSWKAFEPTYFEYDGVKFKVGDSALVNALKFLNETGLLGSSG